MQVKSRFRSPHCHASKNNSSKLFEFATSFKITNFCGVDFADSKEMFAFTPLPCLRLHFTLLLSVTAVLSKYKFKSLISSSFIHLCYCLLLGDDKIRPYFHNNKKVVEKFSNMIRSYVSRFVHF